jgi:hypothetical protein
MITAKLWEISSVPRLVWQVANIATQARRLGRMEEELDDDEEEDAIVKEMQKKWHIRTG